MVLVYISIILILLHNIKILKLKEYSLNPLSLSNSNAMKGLAAIVVVLHHISQRIDNPGLLIFFRYVGYLSVSLFLFYSGYGLMKSFESKKNYLNGFWTERMPKVIIPFVLSNILFLLIYTVIVGTKYSVYDIFTYILGIRLIDGYKWLRLFETDRDSIKIKNFIVQSNVAYSYTNIKDFKFRTPKFM